MLVLRVCFIDKHPCATGDLDGLRREREAIRGEGSGGGRAAKGEVEMEERRRAEGEVGERRKGK